MYDELEDIAVDSNKMFIDNVNINVTNTYNRPLVDIQS